MPVYQLRLGDTPLATLLDKIAVEAARVAPPLSQERARAIAELVLRVRVQQSSSCGLAPACEAVGAAVFSPRPLPGPGAVRPARLTDRDAGDLPMVFAVTAADEAHPPTRDRELVESLLASVFLSVMAPYLFDHEQCGQAAVCRTSRKTDPFAE